MSVKKCKQFPRVGFLGKHAIARIYYICHYVITLVFVVLLAQWEGCSNESTLASYQRVVFRAHQGIPAFERH